MAPPELCQLISKWDKNDVSLLLVVSGYVQLRLPDGTRTAVVKLDTLTSASESEIAEYNAAAAEYLGRNKFHGTSLAKALRIQEHGFDARLFDCQGKFFGALHRDVATAGFEEERRWW